MEKKALIETTGAGLAQTDLGIQNVHMVSGEDYLGHLWYDPEDEQYIIERPIVINMGVSETGKFSVSPMPLRPYLKKVDQLVVENTHVMWVKPVTDQMEELWRRFTSEVILPTGGGIIQP